MTRVLEAILYALVYNYHLHHGKGHSDLMLRLFVVVVVFHKFQQIYKVQFRYSPRGSFWNGQADYWKQLDEYGV